MRVGGSDHQFGNPIAGEADRPDHRAARQLSQPALALGPGAGVLDQRGREHAWQERHGRDGPPQLLAQDRQLDPAETLA